MKRELKGKYLLAAFITIVIFLLGMLLGMVVESKRVDYMSSVAEEQKLYFGSLQLQYQFMEQLGQEKNCPAASATFEKYMTTLVKAQERLEKYESDANLDNSEFRKLKQEYTQAEINFWLLSEKEKNICERDSASIIYFYSTDKNCADCDEQAFILSYLKQAFKDRLYIFTIDETLDIEPMVSILKGTYNITTYPSIVIEGKRFSGMTDKDTIVKEICKHYKSNVSECE